MKEGVDKSPQQKLQTPVAPQNEVSDGGEQLFQFKDKRSLSHNVEVLQKKADGFCGKNETAQLQGLANNYSNAVVQPKKNNTGLPDGLKTGIESLSGISMDDVQVHHNSGKPAQLNAHAYAQGNQIHLAPGQEKHLPHEAWHVVQQKQGRVNPTKQLKGTKVNDDSTLEKEADVMGGRAYQLMHHPSAQSQPNGPTAFLWNSTNSQPASKYYAHKNSYNHSKDVAQRKVIIGGNEMKRVKVGVANELHDIGGGVKLKKADPGGRSAKEKWVTDDYKRYYNNWNEFTDHDGNVPVPYGLAKRYPGWYNKPILTAGKFFILGENHGIFGYRELIKESNLQDQGRVLGEGGARDLMDKTLVVESPVANDPVKNNAGKVVEDLLEVRIPKSMYALLMFRVLLNMNKFKKELPENKWRPLYANAAAADKKRDKNTERPYFLDKKQKVYLKSDGYDPIATVRKNIKTLQNVLNNFVAPAPAHGAAIQPHVAQIGIAKPLVNQLVKDIKDPPNDLNKLRKNKANILPQIDAIMIPLRKIAQVETENFINKPAGHLDKYTKAAINDRKASTNLRNQAILHTILKAHANYWMAAMGDNHAGAIEKKVGKIPVVRYTDFFKGAKPAL